MRKLQQIDGIQIEDVKLREHKVTTKTSVEKTRW